MRGQLLFSTGTGAKKRIRHVPLEWDIETSENGRSSHNRVAGWKLRNGTLILLSDIPLEISLPYPSPITSGELVSRMCVTALGYILLSGKKRQLGL